MEKFTCSQKLGTSVVTQLVPPLFVWQTRVVNITHMAEVACITDITSITGNILLVTSFTLTTLNFLAIDITNIITRFVVIIIGPLR